MRFAVCVPLIFTALRFVVASPVAPDVQLQPSSSWITYGTPRDDSAAATDFSVYDHVSRRLQHGHYERLLTTSHRPVVLHDLSTTARPRGKLSNFKITVVDKPESMDAVPAIRLAAAIVEHSWPSRVPVRMRIAFAQLGGSNVLANGGGTHFARMRRIFKEIVPVAAAEAFLGRDLNTHFKGHGAFDVLITINTNTHWYLGTDGRPPRNQYDLATVLLHEIYHNLIFTGGIYVDAQPRPNTDGSVYQDAYVRDEYITRFDSFLATKDGCAILGYLKDKKLQTQTGHSGSQLLAQAVVNDSLYFGFHAYGVMVKLHAPRVFRAKSSIYHIDPETAGADAIMSPMITPGRSQHQIGPFILKMQALFLNPQVKGANPNCPRPLANPAPKRKLTPEERSSLRNHRDPYEEHIGQESFDVPGGRDHYYPHDRRNHHDNHNGHHDRFDHSPDNVFDVPVRRRTRLSPAVVITLSVLGGLLLLGLCIALTIVIIAISKQGQKPPPGGGRIGPGREEDFDEETYDEGNGMPPNGMPPNGMPPNGMPPNGMAPRVQPPTVRPPTRSGRHSSRVPSSKPPSKPSTCRSPSSSARCSPPRECRPPSRHCSYSREPSVRPGSSGRHSLPRPPPSCKPPSNHRSNKRSSRAPSTRPKTEDYFDCA